MSTFSARSAIIPVWLLALGVTMFLMPPLTLATGVLLLTVGIIVPTVALFLWRAPSPTVAEVLHDAEMTNAGMIRDPVSHRVASDSGNSRP